MGRSWMRACGVLCSVGVALGALVFLAPMIGLMQGEDGMIHGAMLFVLAGLVFGAGLVCGVVALVLSGKEGGSASG